MHRPPPRLTMLAVLLALSVAAFFLTGHSYPHLAAAAAAGLVLGGVYPPRQPEQHLARRILALALFVGIAFTARKFLVPSAGEVRRWGYDLQFLLITILAALGGRALLGRLGRTREKDRTS